MKAVKNILLLSIGFAALFLSSGCSTKSQVASQAKQLDSVAIVLNTKLQSLDKTDTVLLQKAILKFVTYSVFIENNIGDTITKTEANGLQQLYLSGKNLKSFAANRLTLKSRGRLVLSQINKLQKDLENGLIKKDDYLKHQAHEFSSAADLIKRTEEQERIYSSNIQDLKNSLFPVESFIKSRNNGLLPAEVKDSISL